ncbi:UDP-N-acetylglucosamine 1-carboxyvinyltransferase [Candidatus Saccharibacteria bacterium CG10_big_fil_rev_8_21_14_0_10_47_8]|nr:MAG: UDP-N-acetylglucosamine 1-carboxyvinyltransferase [Candidatus Saccharibacteria bacterium CG10_big_fil_rev_8_21_14_0_10_47_8]
MRETNQKVGRLIHRIRQERGLTQATFAHQLGTSQSAVNRIEHGKQNLSLETLGRISDVLNKQIISINSAVNLRIDGGHRLHGEITLKTSKNAAVALLCASLLNKGTTRLKRVAKIEEVNRIIEVLTSIGAHVRWVDESDLEIKVPARLNLDKINQEAARKTRAVIMMVGPLMHDYGEFKIPYAGGCEIGRRSVLPHIYGLEEFGTNIVAKNGHYNVNVRRRLPKRPVVLYESGDTVTENMIMAAARFDGETVIKMASANYAIQDLCFFLQKLGVKIDGIGSTTLTIHGVRDIKKSVTYSPSEDPVEAMTFISAAVTTDSSIIIRRAPIEFLELELLKLEKMGLQYRQSDTYKANNGHTNLADITIYRHNGKLKAPEEKLYGRPYPGLNIDNLPYFVPIVAVAKGRTLIHDWVYEDRALMYTEMKKIGVTLELADPHRVFIEGPTAWRATDVVTPSGLRPAVMLLIGMLAAPGVSMLRNVYTINRGYEDLADRLNSLGAHIEVIREA